MHVSKWVVSNGIAVLLLGGASGVALADAGNCASVPQSMPLRPSILAPVASELLSPAEQYGAADGVLAMAHDEAQSVDQVLLRLKIESCQRVAKTMSAPSVVNPNDPAAYKPKSQFDNTPWRFNMTQNGKSMTADEFTAWLKAKGVRVVGRDGGKAATAPAGGPGAAVQPAAPAAPQAPGATAADAANKQSPSP